MPTSKKTIPRGKERRKTQSLCATEDERLVFLKALRTLSELDMGSRFDENPLQVMVRELARSIPQVAAATYFFPGDSDWRAHCSFHGITIPPTPSAIRADFMEYVWNRVRDGDILIIPDLADVPVLDRKRCLRLSYRTAMAFPVLYEGKPEAVVTASFLGKRTFSPSDQEAIRLLRDVISCLYAKDMNFRKFHGQQEVIRHFEREKEMVLSSVKQSACEVVNGMLVLKKRLLDGVARPTELIESLESQVRSLLSYAEYFGLSEAGRMAFHFQDPALAKWMVAHEASSQVKAIVGLRGTNKSELLLSIRTWLLGRGVKESEIVRIDFEDSRFRYLKHATDVETYLSSYSAPERPRHLFLDEIGAVTDCGELLRHLVARGGWNIWFTSSNQRPVSREVLGSLFPSVAVLRLWSDPKRSRAHYELARIWGQVFLSEVTNGLDHVDPFTKQALAEYYSDHLGETRSSREVASELVVKGRRISPNTITLYRRALENAFLLETVEAYDPFEKKVLKRGAKVFWTDLELRAWKFGPAPDQEEKRLALNRQYLALRSTYEKVYMPRNGSDAFLVVEPDGAVTTVPFA